VTSAGVPTANYQYKAAFGAINGWLNGAKTPILPNGEAYHGSTMNFAFVDGHVESMPPTMAATPENLWKAIR
jgi:prepilin-type processing-associated H-X9-DG protein